MVACIVRNPDRSLLLIPLLVLTASCAGTKERHAAKTSPAESISTVKSSPPAPSPVSEDPAEVIISKAQEEYDNGMEALKAGDTGEARDLFDQAIQILMNSSIPLDENPRMRAAFDKMVDDIAALESDLEESPPPTGDEQPSPAEELSDITTYLTPEEARKEFEKVGPEVREITFDIPMVINDQVLSWIDIFKNRGPFRESFIGGYQRYGWYEPMIHRIFEEEGLPADLIYMAFLESTYKTSAYSRARARGIWQFMTPTGREYGLKVNRYVDERAHPEKSTRAAARYMKDLYATLGDWHLAIAAYNTGAGNIMRAQRRSGKTNYWDLNKSKYMLRETKNFVPAILALALMAKDPAKYGFEGLEHNQPLEYDRVSVDGPTQLSLVARLSGSSDDEIKQLNPHLRMGVTPPGEKGYEVMVPAGRGQTFFAAYQAMPATERTAKLASVHTVRRGETLATIASKYGMSVGELRATNNIRNPNRLSIGTELTVPNGAMPERESTRYTPYHVVRRGETLSSISRSYGLRLSTLLDWNGLNERSVIVPGKRLIVSHEAVAQATRTTRPTKSSSAPTTASTAGFVSVPGGGQAPPDTAGEKVLYRVRSGDNLFRIAQKYGTSVENLKAWNNIPGDGIRAGILLTIYPN